jgi:hypothetical protein
MSGNTVMLVLDRLGLHRRQPALHLRQPALHRRQPALHRRQPALHRRQSHRRLLPYLPQLLQQWSVRLIVKIKSSRFLLAQRD